MKPLYNHSSIESAYMVNDYPYGGMRCRIRFWLETDSKKGFRFCSQTENPKKLVWNAPKKSTYSLLAGCMFLDEKEHVTWTGLSEYSNATDVLCFITRFPQADFSRLVPWCMQKTLYCKARAKGKILFTMNGVPQPDSEDEIRRINEEMKQWEECTRALQGKTSTEVPDYG